MDGTIEDLLDRRDHLVDSHALCAIRVTLPACTIMGEAGYGGRQDSQWNISRAKRPPLTCVCRAAVNRYAWYSVRRREVSQRSLTRDDDRGSLYKCFE